MLTQCPECPRRAAGLPGHCIGQSMINDSYCLRARMGDWRSIDAILTWQPGGEPAVTQVPVSPTPPIRPSVAESLSVLERMRACPHRTAEASCGCGGMATCALGKGRDGLASHRDCFACLRSAPGDY